MTIFIAIIAALTLLAVLALVRPLLRPRSYESVSSQRLNATIYKDQLAALDRDLASGAINPADHETTRDELQLRLLDDTAAPDAPAGNPGTGFWSGRRTAALIAVLLPLLSVGTYRWIGDPAALTPGATQEAARLQITQMVESLLGRHRRGPPRGGEMRGVSSRRWARQSDRQHPRRRAAVAHALTITRRRRPGQGEAT